jgi:SAM-dependent methyltransferase
MRDAANVPAGVLTEQVRYYQARAAEYDEWFERRGRYDHGPEQNARWAAEAEQVFAALAGLDLTGDVLELAPGTGIWTERLAATARSITAVDAAQEMLALNRARLGAAASRVHYVQADLFAWQPDRAYDAVCFSFWISHVPLDRLPAFLATVARALRPGGAVLFVDGQRESSSTAPDHSLPADGVQTMTRRLNDGREFQIVKNFYDPAWLAERCAEAGLDVDVRLTPTYFIYGLGHRGA